MSFHSIPVELGAAAGRPAVAGCAGEGFIRRDVTGSKPGSSLRGMFFNELACFPAVRSCARCSTRRIFVEGTLMFPTVLSAFLMLNRLKLSLLLKQRPELEPHRHCRDACPYGLAGLKSQPFLKRRSFVCECSGS